MATFKTVCPRCNSESVVECPSQDAIVNCGECLFKDVEIVRLTVTPIPTAQKGETTMATEAAEEIIRAAFRDALAGEDALTVVQRHAARIDALTLRLISANEEAWRRTVRLEREARDKLYKQLAEIPPPR